MKQTLFIPVTEIEALKTKSEYETFALFLLLKRTLKKGVFYNYNPTALAKYLNDTRYKIERAVKTGVKCGYFEYHDNNLKVNSFRIFKQGQEWGARKKILIQSYDKLSDIIDKLKYLQYSSQKSKREYVVKTSRDFKDITKDSRKSNRSTKKIIKKHQELLSNYPKGTKISDFDNNTIGYRRLSKITNTPTSSIKKMLDNWVKFGLVKSPKTNIKTFKDKSNYTAKAYKKYFSDYIDYGYMYCIGSTVVLHYGSIIIDTINRFYN